MPKARCGRCGEEVNGLTDEGLKDSIREHSETHGSVEKDTLMQVLKVIESMRDNSVIFCWFHKTSGYQPYSVNGIVMMLKDSMNLTEEQCQTATDYLDGKHKPLCSVCTENIQYGNLDAYCSKCNKKLTQEYFSKEVKVNGETDQSRLNENGE